MKTVSLDEEAYRFLKSAKLRQKESFSSVVKRHFGPRRAIEDSAGGWADMSDQEAHDLRRETEKTFGSTLE